MKKVMAWVTTLCLASSLFGMPVAGIAAEDSAAGTNAEETNDDLNAADSAAEGGSQEQDGTGEGDATTSVADDGVHEVPGTIVTPPTVDTDEYEEADPVTDASLYVSFTSYAPSAAVSGLGYELHRDGQLIGSGTFDAKRAPEADDATSADSTGNAEATAEYYAHVTGLEPGWYTFSCAGTGFVPYSQDIELAVGNRTEICLSDSPVAQTDPASPRGIMLYGDFDGNGTVDGSDAGVLVDELDSTSPAHSIFASGEVSLADVQFFASFFLDAGDSSAASRVIKKVDPANMAADAGSASVAGGSIADMFVDNGAAVTLVPQRLDEATGEMMPVDISASDPVKISVDTRDLEMAGLTVKSPVDSEGMPRSGVITVGQSDGTHFEIPFGEDYVAPEQPEEGEDAEAQSGLFGVEEAYAAAADRKAEVDPDTGLIVVDFGTRVAVKKVVITITATNSNKLAEIAQVEFLNDMQERIAPPDLNIPGGLTGIPAKKSFRVTWNPEVNITGYEVMVSQGGSSQTFATVLPTLEVSQLNGSKLANETTYAVKVRSVNGDWRSPWSDSIDVTPKATSAPARPTGVVATGGYGEVNVKWNSAEDAQSYVVYYRKADTSDGYAQLTTSNTSVQLSPLDLDCAFQGYIVAVNDIGSSPASATWSARTTGASSVKVPYYNLINRTAQTGKVDDSHITDVVCGEPSGSGWRDYNDYDKSPNFEPRQVVDGNYDTFYYCKERSSMPEGPTVTFDQAYEIRNIAVTTNLGTGYSTGILEFRVVITDEEGKVSEKRLRSWSAVGTAAPSTLMLTLPEPTTAKSVQIGFMKYDYDAHATISELAFYKADRIQYDLDALWQEGQALTALKDSVTQADLDDLAERIEWRDPDSATEANPSGEQHPNYKLLKQELEYAQDVFDNKDSLTNAVHVNPAIDPGTNGYVGGLSGLQPLGIVASQDDELSIYVGRDNMAVGANTALRLFIAPYGAPGSAVTKQLVATLKAGVNQVKVDLTGVPASKSGELGGPLYVQYLSSDKSQDYTVRTFGGRVIPVLDLYGVTDKAERLERCEAYIKHLEGHVAKLSEMHAEDGHKDGSGQDAAYADKGCVDNATEIGTDNFLFSLPAERILSGIRNGEGSLAEKLEQRLSSDEDMMELFYQHKGFDTTGTMSAADQAAYGAKNGAPAGRQNVRYMDMSGGVFMYAAGNHVGIQYNEGANPVGIDGPVYDADGRGSSGQYLGWGLRHELGHEINQGCYTYAEVTNNYYSQLGGAVNETDQGLRWGDYQKVYDRVTSGIKGAAGGGTGIAMYWQLHLAYDDGWNYKTYDSYAEQMQNLVFARIDAYARNPQSAPKAGENGTSLSLVGADRDNSLMRLACAATQRNLLAFFEAWGLTPDHDTQVYAAQWPKETRAIQYISDATRAYAIDGGVKGTDRLNGVGGIAANVQVSGAIPSYTDGNQVTISLSRQGGTTVFDDLSRAVSGSASPFLGYEVLRDGVPVGFVKADGDATFTDTIATVNNRVFEYSVRGVDAMLNYTAEVPVTFNGGTEVKVHHDGNISKAGWSATSNLYSSKPSHDEESLLPCEPEDSEDLAKLYDNDASEEGTFHGSQLEGDNTRAQITLTFDKPYAVNGFKLNSSDYASIGSYKLETSTDGVQWVTVNPGEQRLDEANHTATQYFGSPSDPSVKNVHCYDASYLRISLPSGVRSATINELDVLGPTGDDIDFIYNTPVDGAADRKLVGGTLAEDFILDAGTGEKIPQGSFVIIGSFEGNSAYNAALLYDQDGKVRGGTFVYFQDVFNDENIGLTKDGRWVYYMPPEKQVDGWEPPKTVRAELYRVDDPLTNEGQRMVAETYTATIQHPLTPIKIETAGQTPSQ